MAPDDGTLTLLSVNLTEKSARELRELVDMLDDEIATDVVNRSIQLYRTMVGLVRGPAGTAAVLQDIEVDNPNVVHCLVYARR